MGFSRPCLDCGLLTRTGSRCEKHQAIIEAKVNAKKALRTHYSGDYKTRAKAVRDSAVACWLCGEVFTDRTQIQADHVEAGNPDSVLLPAHASCNARRGNKPVN
jgi:hypothetical protein